MRKALAVMLIGGSLALGVSTAFANEGGGDNVGYVTQSSQTASAAVLAPTSGTAIVAGTSGLPADQEGIRGGHEMNRF